MKSPFSDIIKKNNELIFNVTNIDVSILNSIRRVILSEIENVAFEYEPYNIGDEQLIKITKNTCPLHNEFLQQRLSMIPINFSANEIINFDQSKYKFVISKKNKSNEMLNVTTKDIEIYNEKGTKYDNNFISRLFPEDQYTKDHILITKLKPNLININEGDEFNVEMYATKNIAKNYAGFGVVSKCVYYNEIDDEQANKILSKKIEEFKKENEGFTSEDIENLKIDFNNLDRQRYFCKNEFDEPNKFVFTIESECALAPNYLFYKAILILINKIENLIIKITNENISFVKVKNSDNLYNLTIQNEKDTLGNLLQSLLYNKFIREGKKKDINYIGYQSPHPLENHMIIKVQFTNKDADIKKIFIDGLQDIQNYLKQLNDSWKETSGLSSSYAEDIL